MRRRTMMTVALVAVASTALLAGCSGNADNSADDPPTTPSVSAGDPSSASPESSDPPSTGPTEPTEPSATADPAPSDSTTVRAKKAQIPARQLPGLNDGWEWTKASSGAGPGQEVPSVCQKASLTSIGAVAEYRTDFGSPLSDQAVAVQTTGVFPDEQTVATALSVLEAWHKTCRATAQDQGLKRASVGALRTVATPVGDGHQWLTTYRPVAGDPDSQWFQAAGYVADGDTLTFLVITNPGQDYNYDEGQQPMDLAVEVAGQRLLASR
jgi:hypothetical protein